MRLETLSKNQFWAVLEANDMSPKRTFEALKLEFGVLEFNDFSIAARMYQEIDRYKANRKLMLLMAECELYWIAKNAKSARDRIDAIKYILDSPHSIELGYDKKDELEVTVKNLPAWALDELPKIQPTEDDTI